jgi:hypothetical protein
VLAHPYLCGILAPHLRTHPRDLPYCWQDAGNRLKIERTINLEENLVCACNITKDYILYVFITKTDLPLAFEAIRKVGDYFNRPGGSSAARVELLPKKVVEVLLPLCST